MGHYFSEIGGNSVVHEKASEQEQRIVRLTTVIQEDIDRNGIARVLAEFIIHNENNPYTARYPRQAG